LLPPGVRSAGALPQTTLGELTAPPDPLAGFKGPTSKGREGRGRKRGQEGEGRIRKKERGWRGNGKEGRGRGQDGRESLAVRGKERERGREKGRGGKIYGARPPNVSF